MKLKNWQWILAIVLAVAYRLTEFKYIKTVGIVATLAVVYALQFSGVNVSSGVQIGVAQTAADPQPQCKTIGDPVVADDNIFVFDFGPSAVTADYMSYAIGGGTSVVFTLKLRGSTDLTVETATTSLVKNDTTFSVGTAISDTQVVDIDIDTVTGTVPWLTVCLRAS